MQLANQVTIGGIVASEPIIEGIGSEKNKDLFCSLLLCHNTRKPYPPVWIIVRARRGVAAYIVEKLKLVKGDAVSVQGYFGNKRKKDQKGIPDLIVNATAVALFYPGKRRDAKFFEQSGDDIAAPIGGFEELV